MRLAELLADISYTATNFQDVTVTDLVYDSRKVVKGCAFICLKGAAVDGHTFAQQAVEQGAAVLIVQDDVTVTYEIPVIKVSHTRQALAMMSAGISVGSVLRLSCKEADDHWSDGNKRENHDSLYDSFYFGRSRLFHRFNRHRRCFNRRNRVPYQ